jgi:hypothetical protein
MRLLYFALFVFITGCATVIGTIQLDERYGSPDPSRFDHPSSASSNAPDYWTEVRPVLDQRCVSCHACYDAPCQLNLSSYEGLTRGANPTDVYAAVRVTAAEPTRLNFDALSNADWRKKGFFPVLNERKQISEGNREGGVLYRLLSMKQLSPGPKTGPITNKDLDFSLNRDQICVRAEGLNEYAASHPERGMPFGLPALNNQEHQTLSRWIEAGAPYAPPPPLPATLLKQVNDWELLLNGNTPKEQLTARYIYEHWFAGQFFFAEAPNRYFQIVRSKTAPGQAIDLIATRRPYDAPGTNRVYYRLRYTEASQVAKTYLPIQLDPSRIQRIKNWFLTPDYPVAKLPSYHPKEASNPFITFQDLPIDGRYRFMLDEAQFILGGFMKGPVCRGQVALNVINDHFWIGFVAPNPLENEATKKLLTNQLSDLQLPAEHESNAGLLDWRQYAKLENAYLEAKRDAMTEISKKAPPNLSQLWDGDGTNPNAALTVFRHFDSASVMQGYVGERPQTMLILGYPLLERMHYLLLAGFDIFGNTGHQLTTRLYMDFLRMEGELTFLNLLPLNDRQAVRNYWYRGREANTGDFLSNAAKYFPQETGIQYHSKDSLSELYKAVQQRAAPIRNPALDWKNAEAPTPQIVAQIKRLGTIHGIPASIMPEQSLLLIRQPDDQLKIVSLVRNSAHSNVAQLFGEDSRRIPKEDELLALNGVTGAYPNALFIVSPEQLAEFTNEVAKLRRPADLSKLADRFGVRRTDPAFWPLSDALHKEWQRIAPREAAILDYSRLENF